MYVHKITIIKRKSQTTDRPTSRNRWKNELGPLEVDVFTPLGSSGREREGERESTSGIEGQKK